MKSFDSNLESLGKHLLGAWSALGLPFSEPPVEEAGQGLIDPEASILLVVLVSDHPRVATDVPAWICRYSYLINYWKIKSLFSLLAPDQKESVVRVMRGSPFEDCPAAFKRAVGLGGSPNREARREIRARIEKIAPVEALSDSCTMIRNRLLFGAGFRADLVSVIQAVPHPLRGRQVAGLIGCAESTASRILYDLQVCGFLDRHNQAEKGERTGFGLFLSADSLRNVSVLLQAAKFESEELQRSEIEGLDLRFDGLMQKVFGQP